MGGHFANIGASDKKQDPAKAKMQSANTFEAAESLIETSVSDTSISQNSEKSTVSEKNRKIKESTPPAGSSINTLSGIDSIPSDTRISQKSEKSTVSEKKGGKKYKILPQAVLRTGGRGFELADPVMIFETDKVL